MKGLKKSLGLMAFALFAAVHTLGAEDNIIVIEGEEIRGDQEQPKILYIVPWQRPGDSSGLESADVELVGTGLLAPLYREEFQREVSYFKLFNAPEQRASEETSE